MEANVVKSPTVEPVIPGNAEATKSKRDEWMTMDSFGIPTYSNDSKRAQRLAEKEKQKSLKSIDKVS